MNTTVRDASPRTDGSTAHSHTGLDAVWHRARRAARLRALLIAVLAGATGGLLWLLDIDHWPPRFHPSLSGHLPGAAMFAAAFFVFFLALTWFQQRNSWRRTVSPLLGLDRERTHVAKHALSTATPSDDPLLRAVETARAEQLVQTAPKTLGAALVVPVIYVVATIVVFVAGTTLVGVVWVVATVVTTATTLRNLRAGQAARGYLGRLDGQAPLSGA